MLVVRNLLRIAGSLRRYSERKVGSVPRNCCRAVPPARYRAIPVVLEARYCWSTVRFVEMKLARRAGFSWRYVWTAALVPVLRLAAAAELVWRNSLSAAWLPTM